MGSDAGATARHRWRIAEQRFSQSGFDLETEPYNDGYVMTIEIDGRTRRVFFDPAGRITHIRPI